MISDIFLSGPDNCQTSPQCANEGKRDIQRLVPLVRGGVAGGGGGPLIVRASLPSSASTGH